jgi:replicative DNA helicase
MSNRKREAASTADMNIPAEQSLLGCVLRRDQVFFEVHNDLEPADFADPRHQLIWKTIEKIASRAQGRFDAATVADFLQGTDESVPRDYLDALADAVSDPSAIQQYVRTVVDLSRQRAMVQAMQDGITRLRMRAPDEALNEVVDEINGNVLDAGRADSSTQKTLGEFAELSYRRIEAVRFGHTKSVNLSWGLSAMDEACGPAIPGHLHVIGGRPEMGKALSLCARVLLADGQWKAMGELMLGDRLASIDGAASRISGIFPRGRRQVFNVRFRDGRTTQACGEHLWRVHHRHWDEPRILTTDAVASLLQRKRYQRRLYIDLVSGHFGDPKLQLPIDPYVLGCLLGHSSFRESSLRIGSVDHEVIERMQARTGEAKISATAGDRHVYSIRSSVPGPPINWLMDALARMGLEGKRCDEKFVPDIYLQADRQSRLELLRGLMDTDGHASYGAVEFSSTSERLALDVQSLARSLGAVARIERRKTRCFYKGEMRGQDSFRCRIRHEQAQDFFTLPRKMAGATRVGHNTVTLTFDSIEPVGIRETRCIAVTHPSSLYVTDGYIVTHNTALATTIALALGRQAPGGIIQLEMRGEAVADRSLSHLTDIPAWKITRNEAHNSGYLEKYADAIAELHRLPIRVEARPGLTTAQIRAKCIGMKRRYGCVWFIFDHIQIVQAAMRRADPSDTIDEFCRTTAALAKELDAVMIALSQVNSKNRDRDNDRPQPRDLMYYNSIEPHADVIAFPYRPEVALRERRPPEPMKDDTKAENLYFDWQQRMEAAKDKAEIICGKNRHGPSGEFRPCLWDGPTMRFKPLESALRSADDNQAYLPEM